MRRFFVLSLAVLSACASSGRPEPATPVSETIRLNGGAAGSLTLSPSSSAGETSVAFALDKVWSVLPTVLDTLGIPIGLLDPAQHIVGNAGFKLRRQMGGVLLSRYFNCGETQIGPNADSYDMYLVANVHLTPASDGTTTIETSMDASARPISFSQAFTRCTTKGELEKRIVDGVKKRLDKIPGMGMR